MKTFAIAAVLLLVGLTLNASAQYIAPVTTYYAPAVAPAYYPAPVIAPRRAFYAPAPVVAAPVVAPPVVAPPVVAAPVTTYYAPAPVVAAPAPVTTYYAPAPVAAPVVAAPVVAPPVVVARYGRSIYGTRQVYYPGQPVLNTLRAITP